MGRHPQKGDDGGLVDEFEPLTFVHIAKCFMNQNHATLKEAGHLLQLDWHWETLKKPMSHIRMY